MTSTIALHFMVLLTVCLYSRFIVCPSMTMMMTVMVMGILLITTTTDRAFACVCLRVCVFVCFLSFALSSLPSPPTHPTPSHAFLSIFMPTTMPIYAHNYSFVNDMHIVFSLPPSLLISFSSFLMLCLGISLSAMIVVECNQIHKHTLILLRISISSVHTVFFFLFLFLLSRF